MKKTLVTLVLILNMVAVPAAAVALDTASGEAQGPAPHKATLIDIEDCNRQILLKEIELERYSINCRKKNNVQGRYRGWRYFISQEANASLTSAGLLRQLRERQNVIDANNRVGSLRRRPNRQVLESGLICQLVGQSIGGTGSAIELGINMVHEQQARKQGYGPRAGIAKVMALKQQLEQLFEQRRKLVSRSDMDPEDLAIALREEAVLRDITDMGLHEYCDFHAGARRYATFQNALYIFDMAKNATGVSGNIVGLNGLHRPSPRLSGAGSILTCISGFLTFTSPLASRGSGLVAEKLQRRRLKPIIAGHPRVPIDKLNEDRSRLKLAIASRLAQDPTACKTQTLAMLAYCEQQTELRQAQLELSTREVQSGTRSATQNVLVGAIVGGTKMSFGTTGIIGGFRYPTQPLKANAVAQAGTISYAAGSFVSVADNVRLRVLDEYNRRRLSRKRQLPSQVLADRLDALSQLETTLAFKN
ncbi:MAG: hypothetical protein QG625_80 [Cyanobacteriota bacterium erpe_2018_sw_39hr_WHONDRS-SW48-000098_B_bin.30]|nr:hypothetical protein [Cyanobacteriota bacterium erpe_2018_sw_39hr_WHONDRS-SW48-000098_B_bin.30]